MTVTLSETRVSFNGNGATLSFAYGYKFFRNADLIVYLVEIADTTNAVLQVLDTNYTVTGAGSNSGGSVVMVVAPPTGYKLVIINDPQAIQDKDYVNADDFPAESHEEALDRLTKLVQRLQDRMARTAQIPDASDDDPPNPQEMLAAAVEALESADNASLSEQNAADSETAAASSEVAAASSAAAASSSEDAASDSETAAVASAATAAAAAAAASTSAGAASTSASAAGSSATDANTSKIAAASSATAAASSQVAAANSATASESSATASAASADEAEMWASVAEAAAGGGVISFNSRTGTVTPANNDYTFASLASKPTSISGYGITDAYTKTEVDNFVLNAGKRARVRAATTANITISTALNNGDTLDGVVLATNDLVLVKDQSTAAQNGVYVVGVTPARDTSFDTYDEHPGSLIAIKEGSANADMLYICTSNEGGTLNSTAIDWTKLQVSIPTSRLISAGGLVTGGGDLSADRTLTVTEASNAEMWAGTATDKAVTPRRVATAKDWIALTDASTITVDSTVGRNFKLASMAGNRTLGFPSGTLILGDEFTFWIKQDGTGSRTLAYGSGYVHDGDSAPTIGTTASKGSLLRGQVLASDKILISLVAANFSA